MRAAQVERLTAQEARARPPSRPSPGTRPKSSSPALLSSNARRRRTRGRRPAAALAWGTPVRLRLSGVAHGLRHRSPGPRPHPCRRHRRRRHCRSGGRCRSNRRRSSRTPVRWWLQLQLRQPLGRASCPLKCRQPHPSAAATPAFRRWATALRRPLRKSAEAALTELPTGMPGVSREGQRCWGRGWHTAAMRLGARRHGRRLWRRAEGLRSTQRTCRPQRRRNSSHRNHSRCSTRRAGRRRRSRLFSSHSGSTARGRHEAQKERKKDLRPLPGQEPPKPRQETQPPHCRLALSRASREPTAT
jgi:hypothetical protein